ncbi:DNA-binding transcriptional LysR family regulator [Rhodoligotrophos appendicifer]|uniref:LysR family transcriptional regulator n=1 Tax=Rhodoligotrophos appendicifer TaxID=987056 RepID=UPI001184F957|nr:LysR family transcriptional regulator [Rhodoligotrophos appendicifer]
MKGRSMAKGTKFDFNLFRSIEVFVAVVETRHVTQAAEMLGMTQSAASQHLKNLERALGVVLIDRNLRPIELTKAGVVLHRRAVTILGEVEGLLTDARRENSAPLPLLRIALLASIATTLAPALSVLARNRFKVPELSLFASLAHDHVTLLRSRRTDLAVTSGDLFEIDGLVRYPVLSERFLLVTPKGFRGPLDDLAALAKRLPLVRFSRETPVGMRTDQHLSRVRVELPRVMEGDRSSVVMAPVAAGMGFAIMSPSLLIDGVAEGMQIDVHPLPIASFSREITLVAREREFGELPEVFARCCADTLVAAIQSRLPSLTAEHYNVTLPPA